VSIGRGKAIKNKLGTRLLRLAMFSFSIEHLLFKAACSAAAASGQSGVHRQQVERPSSAIERGALSQRSCGKPWCSAACAGSMRRSRALRAAPGAMIACTTPLAAHLVCVFFALISGCPVGNANAMVHVLCVVLHAVHLLSRL
jgi:hypothetical protein